MKKFTAFLAIIMVAVFVISSCNSNSFESSQNPSSTSQTSTTSTEPAANSNVTSTKTESADNSSKPETSRPDESDMDSFINWYFDTFTSNEDDFDVRDLANKTSDDFAKIIKFGEAAFPLLDDIITKDEYDLESFQRQSLALFIKYSIKPELYEHMYYSPDKKYELKKSPKYFGRYSPFQSDISYKFELIDSSTQKVKLTTDDAFGLAEIEWSPNSQYIAISHGEMRRFFMTDAIDVKNAKFIELPKQKELKAILNEKYPNKYSVDGSFLFDFKEWVDENQIKIRFVLYSDLMTPDCEGWYIYDFTKNEIVELEVQKVIAETKTFSFKVKDNMPEYKCVVNIGMNEGIAEIIITEKDSGKVIQTITPNENYIYMKSALYFEDVTFDGALDILVPITKSNRRLYIGAYIWDETKKQFIYQEDFEELGNIKIDSTNKKIMTHNSIWLDSGRNAEVYSVYKYSNNKFVLEKQFSITPSEDKKTAAFKETSGEIGKQTIVTQFELPLDTNGTFDKNNNKIKPYYITGSAWDLDSDKWISPFVKELK